MSFVNAGLGRVVGRVEGAQLGIGESTGLLLLRNLIAYRAVWWVFVSGFLEPVFYLFSIGIGVGKLVHGFEFHGEVISYAAFVAPGMLAASAMNGSLLDATYNFFFKLKFSKLFDQMLATPLTTRDIARGELSWSLLRGGTYSAAFLGVMAAMGLVHSWWALAAAPAALLIGLAFGGACMALTTWMRSWQDFEYITLGTLPLFLFSATFFPLSAFPAPVQWLVQLTPLYRGVVLCRELTTGVLTWESAASVVYLVAMGVAGLLIVGRRLDRLLLS
jgi:lipooligosaccharide transport system permease protein